MKSSAAKRLQRPQALRLLWAVLIGTIALFAIASVSTAVLIFKTQDSLSRVAHYDVAWSASQGVSEYTRLLQRITSLAGGTHSPERNDVQLRLEILKSRLQQFGMGDFKEFLGASAERQATLNRLNELVEWLDSKMPSIGQPETATLVVDAMEAQLSALIGLASEAYQFSGNRVSGYEHELSLLRRNFSAATIGFFLFGLSFIALLSWHNRLLKSEHLIAARANADLKRTSRELIDANAAVQRVNQELTTQNQLFETALNNMGRGLCLFDACQRLIVCNRRFAEIYGLSAEHLVPGVTLRQIMRMVAESLCSPKLARSLMRQQMLLENSHTEEVLQHLADGRVISICQEPMPSGGWVITFEEITERYAAEQKIAYMARHDPLTGLSNRLGFAEHVKEIALSANAPIVLMSLDLDNFKNVNDTLGHPIGDALLCEVASRIADQVGEKGLVSRLGGDEFVVVLQNRSVSEAIRLAQKLTGRISEPFQIDGHSVEVGTSVGIAAAQVSDMEPAELLKNADMALYNAKETGRGTYRVFEPGMNARLERAREIERELRLSDLKTDFQLLFQPIVDVHTHKVVAIEALLRWNNSRLGAVGPEEFIPVAEKCGVIFPLEQWVLEMACTFAMRIPSHVRIAVNLSASQFRRAQTVQKIKKILREIGLPPQRLELEITETVLLDDSAEVRSSLQKLRSMGVRLSLDDFGTGYSSLAYLRRFTVDTVKVDRSFVGEIASNSDHLAIVQAIVGLGHSLGMNTVAEGIETEEQLTLIRASGCREAQGYLFSPPVTEENFQHLLDPHGRISRVA